jgi:hypothetical protein
VQQVFLLNKNSFFRIRLLPSFCIKTNFRENRFFGTRWAIGSEKAIPCVKICAENYTKRGCAQPVAGKVGRKTFGEGAGTADRKNVPV